MKLFQQIRDKVPSIKVALTKQYSVNEKEMYYFSPFLILNFIFQFKRFFKKKNALITFQIIALFVTTLMQNNLFAFGNVQNGFIDKNVKDLENILHFEKNNNVFQLFTHGRPGELLINNEWMNTEQIAEFLKPQLSPSISHINIYGCEFAKGKIGEKAVAFLQNKLGISVAASTNITGKNGDWNLEVGNSIATIKLPNYQGNLQYGAAPCMGAQTVTMKFSGGVVTSGTGSSVGSTIKYSNVLIGATQQVDAVFTLNSLNFGSSTIQQSVNFQYDVPGSTIGFENNFQPSFIGNILNPYPALGTYILSQQWTVNFYIAGTNTPVNLPIIVEVFDNDGTNTPTSTYKINEIVTFNTPPNSIVTSAAGATPTTETVNGNTVTSDNSTQSGIGTGLQYMVYANYASVSSFQITIKDSLQFNANGSSWGSRYHSFIIGCQNLGATNFPCAAGTTAPAITATTLSNNCPATTADLTSLANTGTVPSGATLVWSTHNPPTSANDTLTSAQVASVATGATYYAYYRAASGCFSPADSVKTIANTACCPYGVVSYYRYATYNNSATIPSGWGSSSLGAPNIFDASTNIAANRMAANTAAGSLYSAYWTFDLPIKPGDTITFWANRPFAGANDGFTVALSDAWNGTYSANIGTVLGSQITSTGVNASYSGGPYTKVSVVVPTGMTGTNNIAVRAASTSGMVLFDAVKVSNTFCNTCPAGVDAPILSDDGGICAPATTFNVASVFANNMPPNTILTWHSASPATSANEIPAPTAATTGTYYAAFKSTISGCYSGINGDGTATSKVQIYNDLNCAIENCTYYSNIICNGSFEEFQNCPAVGTNNFYQAGVSCWSAISTPEFMSTNPTHGCNAQNPTGGTTGIWSTANATQGADGYSWIGSHSGEKYTNTLVCTLPPGTYTVTFWAGWVNDAGSTYYQGSPVAFYNGTTLLGTSATVSNHITPTNQTWKQYSVTFTTTTPMNTISFVPTAGSSFLYLDDFQLLTNACSQAPIIPATIVNKCPGTDVNLTGLINTGTAPIGSTLVWSTHNPPYSESDTLTIAQTTAVAGTTYYAFYHNEGNCFSVADSVKVLLDSDCDGIPDDIDLDDDNDGILDEVECGTVIKSINTASNWALVEDATAADSTITLTTTANFQQGAAWYPYQIDITQPFNYKYKAYLGTSDAGADGIAFVISADPRDTAAIGECCWGLGAYDTYSGDGCTNTYESGGTGCRGGIYPSLILEMDTYYNEAGSGNSFGDLTSNDHLSINNNSNANQIWPGTYVSLPNIENGLWHNVEVDYDGSVLKVYWDNVLKITTTTNIATDFLDGNSFAYIGYTSSTGSNVNLQRIIPTSLTATFNPECPDTDGDGIPNSLDLDSDGDGCPDAIEGGASFTNTNLVESSMPGGNTSTSTTTYNGTANYPVDYNLGNNVDANGVPTVAIPPLYSTYGQTVNLSQDKSSQDADCCAAGYVAPKVD